MKGVLADGQKKSTVHGDGSSGRLVALTVVVVVRLYDDGDDGDGGGSAG